jgi:transcriptional regulator with XRE-family HTH domain
VVRSIVLKSRAQQFVEAREGRELADLLTELYVDQHLTQEQVAARLGVRRATVSRWMNDLGIESRWIGSRKEAA